jgi:hypothetical protein
MKTQKQANDFAYLYQVFEDAEPHKIDMSIVGKCPRGVKLESPEEFSSKLKDISCKSAGCLVGYLPIAFPRRYEFRMDPPFVHGDNTVGVRSKKSSITDYLCFIEAFGITYSEASHLYSCTYKKGQVAKNIVLRNMEKLADRYGWKIE